MEAAAVKALSEEFPDAWEQRNLSVAGDSASWKWRYELADGPIALGCDFCKFADRRNVEVLL